MSEAPVSLRDKNKLSWKDLAFVSGEVFVGHESEGPGLAGKECVNCWCCDKVVLVENAFIHEESIFCSEQHALHGIEGEP